MENQFQPAQPAFAPQRPIIPTGGAIRPPKKRTSVLTLVASLLFILAAGGTGTLFFYKQYLIAENGGKAKQIQDAVNEVKTSQPELTKSLTLLKARIDVAKPLLQNHAAFTAFLDLLQKNTVTSVQYTEFKYDAPAPDKIALTMKGRAPNYTSIAFQSDVLAANENLKSVIFANLALSEGGLISFDVKAGIDPKVVSYSAKILSEIAPVPPEQEAVSEEMSAPSQASTTTDAMTAPAPEEAPTS